MRTRSLAVAVALLLSYSVTALAHVGHPHRFLGTVSAVTGSQIEVKTTDGKTVIFALDAKSVIQRGRAKTDAAELKVGERIVVSAMPVAAGKTMTAINVQLPAAAGATAAQRAAK